MTKKHCSIYLIASRIMIVLALIVCLAFVVWMQGQAGKLSSFFQDIAWVNLIFWALALLPVLITSFSESAHDSPTFWAITSTALPLFAYTLPMVFMINQTFVV